MCGVGGEELGHHDCGLVVGDHVVVDHLVTLMTHENCFLLVEFGICHEIVVLFFLQIICILNFDDASHSSLVTEGH